MSKIHKINIQIEEKTESIICGNAKVFLHFVNLIQEALKENPVKTAKQAQDELNAHGISWEEFNSKIYDKDKFQEFEEIAINDFDNGLEVYNTAVKLIQDTFGIFSPEENPEEENLPEPDVITAKELGKYARCGKCGYEDFLRDDETECRDCGKPLGELTRVTCKNADCIAEVYVNDAVKICPYCETDLYDIQERCENAGVVQSEDPVKAAKINEKKKQEIGEEIRNLASRKATLEKIINPIVKESLDELMQVTSTYYQELIFELLEETEEKKIKALTTLKNKSNSLISSITAVKSSITGFDSELAKVVTQTNNAANRLKNFQVPLEFASDGTAEIMNKAIEEANKEAAQSQEVPEVGNPITVAQLEQDLEETREAALAGGMEEEHFDEIAEEYQESEEESGWEEIEEEQAVTA